MSRRQFFDQHAREWDAARPADLAARLERVAGMLDLGPGHRVLDVGTGTGALVPAMLARVGETGAIVALDSSAEMLAMARGKGFPTNVTFMEADIERAPELADASFDRVACNAAFPHLPHRQQALAEMVRVLRPGGLLVISHPIGRDAVEARHRQHGEAVAADHVPPPAEMRELLREAGLADIFIIDEPEFYLAAARKPPKGT